MRLFFYVILTAKDNIFTKNPNWNTFCFKKGIAMWYLDCKVTV